ncbi:MAG TPA: hypothetical protein VF136_20135, partial [Methylomirabilota bacterium]
TAATSAPAIVPARSNGLLDLMPPRVSLKVCVQVSQSVGGGAVRSRAGQGTEVCQGAPDDGDRVTRPGYVSQQRDDIGCAASSTGGNVDDGGVRLWVSGNDAVGPRNRIRNRANAGQQPVAENLASSFCLGIIGCHEV